MVPPTVSASHQAELSSLGIWDLMRRSIIGAHRLRWRPSLAVQSGSLTVMIMAACVGDGNEMG